MIPITATIQIDESELHEEFIRSSGAGGQNVNKVATAVQLRFDAANSRALPADVFARLKTLAGHRMTDDGVLIIKAQSWRTQERNRQDARERFIELLREAAKKPVVRRATKPSRASKERRLESKRRQSVVKQSRRVSRGDDGV